MHPSSIRSNWPNALRWFLAQELNHFTPWHFISKLGELNSAASAFSREDVDHREVFVFAYRQDCDDCAGLEIVGGKVTDRVIWFHPSYSIDIPKTRTWNIVNGSFDDVFDFVALRVIPDMKDWASTEDASKITRRDT